MPNWCNNVVRLSHENPAMIDRAVTAFDDGKFLQEFVPCPAPLLNPETTTWGHGPEEAEREALRKQLTEEFGYQSWYDWCVANWGTKWDVGGENPAERHDANNITIVFDSAWAPPIEAYGQLEQQGFVVEAYYYEPGMAFCGIYEDGCANDIEIPGSSDDAAKVIPRAINEMFNIVEQMEEWEQTED